MEGKDLLKSKTFYFNLIVLIIGIIEVWAKVYPIDVQLLTFITLAGNLLLRMISGEKIVSFAGIRIKN